MRRTGDLKLIQELNRSIIFDTIREKGPISRSEIAKKNGLSPTTVTAAVFDLIAEGLVKEGGTGTSSGGRKPIMLQFSPDSRSIIVVSITNTNLTVGEVNLNAEVKRKRQFNFPDFKGDQVIDYTLQAVQEFLEDIPNRESCLGISLSVSGIVDAQEGVLLYNNQLKL
jgi:DNA-binding Lrp family transcriptional regulator